MNLSHRIVLAPLTRSRAETNTLTPNYLHAEYYSQRATKGGLLISEATFISTQTLGYAHSPGIWTKEHVNSWKPVTDAVHKKGGYIFCQLWHIGRVAHPSFKDHPLVRGNPAPSVSASNVNVNIKTPHYNGTLVPSVDPRPLTLEEIGQLVEDYRHAAKCAREAGFDGVELHGAHGYLMDQFLNDGTNKRTDRYGGSVENRCRLLLEVTDALTQVLGSDRVAVRLSPHNNDKYSYHGVNDSDPVKVYSQAVSELSKRDLAYLLFTEPRWDPYYRGDALADAGHSLPSRSSDTYRHLYKGVLFGAGGYTPQTGVQAVEDGKYDGVGFGRWYISNPDLVERIRLNQPLNVYNRDTFYTPTYDTADLRVGYTDYPTFPDTLKALRLASDLAKRTLSGQELTDILKLSASKTLPYKLTTADAIGKATSQSQGLRSKL